MLNRLKNYKKQHLGRLVKTEVLQSICGVAHEGEADYRNNSETGGVGSGVAGIC